MKKIYLYIIFAVITVSSTAQNNNFNKVLFCITQRNQLMNESDANLYIELDKNGNRWIITEKGGVIIDGYTAFRKAANAKLASCDLEVLYQLFYQNSNKPDSYYNFIQILKASNIRGFKMMLDDKSFDLYLFDNLILVECD